MPSANLDQIDAVLRLIDREVWIITSAAIGKRGGLTATWVSAASIDRQQPVVLAGLAPNHFTTDLIEKSHAFVAHLLRTDQSSLAFDFARDSSRDRDKLAGLKVAVSASGVPLVRDCLAWLDCRVFARHDAGDRLFFWADVVAGGRESTGIPLREQSFFGSLSPPQKQALISGRDADVEFLRPLRDSWRAALDEPRPP